MWRVAPALRAPNEARRGLCISGPATHAARAKRLAEQGEQRALLLTARVAMVVAAALTASFGLARDPLALGVLAAVEGLDAVWDTSLRVLFAIVGRSAGAGEGEVLGVVGFLQVLVGSVLPSVYQQVYAATVAWCPAFAFYLTAALTLAGFGLSFALRPAAGGPRGGAGGAKPPSRVAEAGEEAAGRWQRHDASGGDHPGRVPLLSPAAAEGGTLPPGRARLLPA